MRRVDKGKCASQSAAVPVGEDPNNKPPGAGAATYYPPAGGEPARRVEWDTQAEHAAPPGSLYRGGRFRVERKLGVGGCAVVYLARDQELGRQVALKELNPEALASEEMRQRFGNEARAAVKLQHEAIVQVLDIFEEPERGPVITMEYVAGGDLYGHLRQHGRMDPIAAAEMFAKVADALQTAHDQGIVHRDVKPQNILLTETGAPKLTDFGIAHIDTSDAALTSAQVRMGTPDYMAPELNFGAAYASHASDIYAVGASLYYVVTGERPKTIRLEKVPEHLREIVDRCVLEDPEARYISAQALADALRTAARKLREAARVPSGSSAIVDDAMDEMQWSRRYGKMIGAAAILVAVAITVGATVATQTGDGSSAAASANASLPESELASARVLVEQAQNEATVLAAIAALDSLLDRAPDNAEALRLHTDLLATGQGRALLEQRRRTVQEALAADPPKPAALEKALRALSSVDRSDAMAKFGPRWLRQ